MNKPEAPLGTLRNNTGGIKCSEMWVIFIPGTLLLVKSGKIGLLKGLLKEFILSVLCVYSKTLGFHDLIKLLPLNVDQLYFQSISLSCLFFNFFRRKKGAIIPAPLG